MSKEEVYLNIKNRYLGLNEELKGNIETFIRVVRKLKLGNI